VSPGLAREIAFATVLTGRFAVPGFESEALLSVAAYHVVAVDVDDPSSPQITTTHSFPLRLLNALISLLAFLRPSISNAVAEEICDGCNFFVKRQGSINSIGDDRSDYTIEQIRLVV
jgi:hypothetical protein